VRCSAHPSFPRASSDSTQPTPSASSTTCAGCRACASTVVHIAQLRCCREPTRGVLAEPLVRTHTRGDSLISSATAQVYDCCSSRSVQCTMQRLPSNQHKLGIFVAKSSRGSGKSFRLLLGLHCSTGPISCRLVRQPDNCNTTSNQLQLALRSTLGLHHCHCHRHSAAA
jgi:hypothetical protein